jgi:hypothetical protein
MGGSVGEIMGGVGGGARHRQGEDSLCSGR